MRLRLHCWLRLWLDSPVDCGSSRRRMMSAWSE
nr:MAG TPA: hypothetical protein [Caudoviricetes sp.]DAS28959.1 MAG TPA: hypothetical protein [Caudoviricetes sp.]